MTASDPDRSVLPTRTHPTRTRPAPGVPVGVVATIDQDAGLRPAGSGSAPGFGLPLRVRDRARLQHVEEWQWDRALDRFDEPVQVLINHLDVGEDVLDLDGCDAVSALCTAVEVVLRNEAPIQYEPWPDATTDGLVAGLCTRSGPDELTLVALCDLNFDGDRFPLRAVLALSKQPRYVAELTLDIGQVSQDGAPPRLPPTAMVLPNRDAEGPPGAELLVRRVPEPITWTTAVRYPPPP